MFLKNKGFTIVELLIASLLTIITVGISIEVYLAVKKDFQLEEMESKALADASEVRLALSNAVTNAGFDCKYGHFSWHDIENITGDNVPEFGDENYRSIHDVYVDNVNGSTINLPDNAIAGTDYLLIQGASTSSTLTSNATSGTNSLEVNNSFANQLEANNYVVICSSIAYTLAKVSDQTATENGRLISPITLTNNLKWSVYSGDYIGKYQATIYYIGSSTDADGSPTSSLFSYEKNNVATEPQEIMSGISDMQITLHKIGTGNTDDDWLTPSQLNPDENQYRKKLFNEVDAIKIALTINGNVSTTTVKIN
ncbi:PilW family protein [Pseudofrancisella aestuarii]|uniref:PilW family protein n=1 Tax=Pseudofrancisella aestuarii TaxID=2670347 RepID=A0ABV9TBS1_9GAMM|nr:PilW family protein [Pseudofrancisella aestuarii]